LDKNGIPIWKCILFIKEQRDHYMNQTKKDFANDYYQYMDV